MNKNMLKQAQQIQARLAKVQEELESATVEARAGGGVVRVVCNGRQHVQLIAIDSAVVDPDDIEMLEDLVLAAVNEALDKSQAMANEQLNAVTGGLKLPGM